MSLTEVFLPINNPLSPHGHVWHYLEEVGQGVQHFASRVSDLPAFIARANRYREVTGEGLAFLRIPRSYYGFLQDKDVSSFGDAAEIFAALSSAGILDENKVVKLDVTAAEVKAVLDRSCGYLGTTLLRCSRIGLLSLESMFGILGTKLSSALRKSWSPTQAVSGVSMQGDAEELAAVVSRGRYSNLYGLLKDKFTEAEYLRIIENQILVDIQGQDCLLQIFTNPICLEKTGQQSLFMEFIQRVCGAEGGSKALKAGCGGFGIRNFLTLFLSIEVSNFMDLRVAALAKGDTSGAERATKAIAIFTSQLNASNPVLTEMSDAMEGQSFVLDELESLLAKADASGVAADEAEVGRLRAKIDEWEAVKEQIQERIKDVGEFHKAEMAKLMADA